MYTGSVSLGLRWEGMMPKLSQANQERLIQVLEEIRDALVYEDGKSKGDEKWRTQGLVHDFRKGQVKIGATEDNARKVRCDPGDDVWIVLALAHLFRVEVEVEHSVLGTSYVRILS